MVQTDAFPVRLYFLLPTGDSAQPLVNTRLAVGTAIVFTAKISSALSGETLLTSAGGWEEVYDAETETWHYRKVLNLNTDDIQDAFEALPTNVNILNITCECKIQNAGNTERTSYQQVALLRRTVYGGEVAPLDGDPLYPPPEEIVTKAVAGKYRFTSGGDFQLYNAITEKYHTLTATGAADAVELNIDPTGAV